jgi:hypothetical protein
MSSRFVTMLVIGLGLMGFFWWGTWQSESEKTARIATVVGCAKTPNCPPHLPVCHTGHKHLVGVCSAPCEATNQCPENWCCAPAEDPKGQSMCVPRLTCGRLGIN